MLSEIGHLSYCVNMEVYINLSSETINLSKMKKSIYALRQIGLSFMIVLIASLSSCDKVELPEDIITDEETNDPTPPPFPELVGSDGTLVAIKSQSTQSTPIGPMTITIGLGVAVFYETGNTSTFLDAGTVNLNSLQCTKQNNNAYAFQPSADNATGIDFSSGVSWSVSGSANVEAFSFDPSISFPTVDAISSGDVVNKANGYTLTTTSVTGADSVIFQVGSVLKTVAGNSTSCTFSSSDLSGLSTGTSIVQIAGYKMQNQIITAKNYYFINETVVTKTVTIE